MRRRLFTVVAATCAAGVAMVGGAVPAAGCGGLVAPNGTIRLLRTSTLAAYHDGVEHYVTSFQFAGDGAALGSIVPLPAIPTKVERGGDWTLQRLEREAQFLDSQGQARTAALSAASGSSGGAQVVYETKVDALDITILKGGGQEVGQWATEHGFALTPDAPSVLEFYSFRSPIFMAARFDAQAARDRGQQSGDGTPIHLTIPTRNPWVPLRILTLGRGRDERIDANVFLLTDRKPALLPDAPGLKLHSGAPATDSLLSDLRSDKGMEWVPKSMWLDYLVVGEAAGKLRYDLAVDASGRGRPWHLDAGLPKPKPDPFVPITTVLPTTTLSTLAQSVALPRVASASSQHPDDGVPWPALLGGFTLAALIAALATWRWREHTP
jgi:hypothetical protein